jgi:hypothetical protein
MSVLREANAEPIAGYRLIEPLGSGGFGEVWKCEAPGGLFKAIKFVYGNLNSLDVDGVRAEQELHALQRIKEVRHPFVLSLDRIEVVEGELVIVMELADKSLHDLYLECQTAGLIGIPRDDLLRYIRDAAEALDHMNEKHNLQHLDIKPRNLFLISDRVKVADFGLVKHLERQTGSGLLGGVTPLYAPPETFNGKISERSDQYSLAIVYQELLTGQRPYSGKNVRQLAQQHMQEEPELRALPEAERAVVARSLSKDPAKRFPTCLAFVRALYNARNPAYLEQIIPETAEVGAASVSSPRPKTMRDTMENFQLEQAEDAVDLGGPPGEQENVEEVSRLGITIAQPQTGALRPTLVIGLGAFGRQALLELRCRFLDRFGDLAKIPLLRFLCIDPDPEAVRTGIRGAPEVALSRNEIYHLPLQPVGNYRRRMLEQLSEWLPREKLYALPRSLQTQGSRALGRLAFADNHQRLLARLRREIQQASHPDALYRSVSETGLALRDNTPRIYVLAAAGGGSSGLLVDLGYGLRRLLAQLRHPEGELNTFLMCGAPADPATPRSEQANVYATVTELNHYSDPAIPFAAQYGADGNRLVDQGQPSGCVYLLQLAHRSPQALSDAVAHLGSYLFHELTTPLGLRLDQVRHFDPPLGATPFRSFGTYTVWFPRGLLLRLAARQACRRLIDDWLVGGELMAGSSSAETPLLSAPVQAEVDAVCESVVADPQLHPEALAALIEEAARQTPLSELGGTPAEALTGLLATIEEQSFQSVAADDPGNWARQALGRVRDWVGSTGEIGDWRKSRLRKTLTTAAQKVAEEIDERLGRTLLNLMDRPGKRLVAAESAVMRFGQYCQSVVDSYRQRFEQQRARTEQCGQQLEAALEECQGGGSFRFFGGRSTRRLLRDFIDALTAFARQRLQEEMTAACLQFFVALQGRMADRVRDLGFCRQRLRHLQQSLEMPPEEAEDLTTTLPGSELTLSRSPLPSAESFWEAIRQSATARVVLPEGEVDLERAALRFLRRLSSEQWAQLDQALQERVLTPLGGLHTACVSSGDLSRYLALPLMNEAVSCLSEHLPVTDVAESLRSSNQGSENRSQEESLLIPDSWLNDCWNSAVPVVAGRDASNQHTYLLIPASEAGKALGEAVRKKIPDMKVVKAPNQSDLMFCREQGCLSLEDLMRFLHPCLSAYEASTNVPNTSPHARFDVVDWVPIEP